MRDDEHGAALHQRVHTALDDGLGPCVDGRGCFVQNHNRRVGDRRAGDGQKLALPLRQIGAVAGQHRRVAVGQTGDEVVRARQHCGFYAFVVACRQVPVADVVHHRAGEQVRVLQHDAERAAQRAFFDLVDVDAVVADFAVGDVVKAVEQIGDGRFARAGRADEGDLLPRLGVERDVMQDGFALLVAEVNVEHPHVARKPGVRHAAVGLMRVLPRPYASVLAAFGQHAVFLARVHERDVAVVRLGLFVNEVEDALRARKSHHDGVDLMRHLTNVARKLLGHIQKGDNDADAQRQPGNAEVGDAGKQQQAARHPDRRVEDVADVVENGAEGVGEFVGAFRLGKEIFVDAVKVGLAGFLVAEHLDDLLSVHDLLDIALLRAERLLLAHEVARRPAADFFGDDQHHAHARDDDQRQPYAVVEHDEQHRADDDGRDEKLRQALGNELPERVDVVGVVAHNVAVVVRVEVFDRQRLHPAEHLHAQLHQRTLRDDGHHPAVSEGGRQREDVEHGEYGHIFGDVAGNRAPVAAFPAGFDDGDDVLHKDRRHRADDGVEHDAEKHHRQHDRVITEQQLDQPRDRLALVFDGRALLFGFVGFTVLQADPPFCSATDMYCDRSRSFPRAADACRRRQSGRRSSR